MRIAVDVVGQVFRALWAHKLRSFLTMFGIAWGVGSLLLLVGLGEGFRSGNRKQMDSIGEDVMFVFPGRAAAVEGSRQSARYYHLTYQDYLDVAKAPYVRAATPAITRQDVRFVSDYGSAGGQLVGAEPQFKGIRYIPIRQGRWINEPDNEQQRRVALVGAEVVKNLFPGRPVLGSTILLNGVSFEVVGVVDTIGRGENIGPNSRVYIPFRTMAVYFPMKGEQEADAISTLMYQPVRRADHLLAREEVRKVIGRNHGFDWRDEDNFEDWDTIRSAEMVGKIFDAMNMFLGSVGLVTLALGAIGVINIMLVSVTERTREIGLRKALGATYRTILFQFFMEGLLITTVSGAIGMGAAAAIMAALAGLPAPQGFDTPQLVPSSAALAIGALTVAGVAAGLYPARKAAMLAPVEALRQE